MAQYAQPDSDRHVDQDLRNAIIACDSEIQLADLLAKIDLRRPPDSVSFLHDTPREMAVGILRQHEIERWRIQYCLGILERIKDVALLQQLSKSARSEIIREKAEALSEIIRDEARRVHKLRVEKSARVQQFLVANSTSTTIKVHAIPESCVLLFPRISAARLKTGLERLSFRYGERHDYKHFHLAGGTHGSSYTESWWQNVILKDLKEEMVTQAIDAVFAGHGRGTPTIPESISMGTVKVAIDTEDDTEHHSNEVRIDPVLFERNDSVALVQRLYSALDSVLTQPATIEEPGIERETVQFSFDISVTGAFFPPEEIVRSKVEERRRRREEQVGVPVRVEKLKSANSLGKMMGVYCQFVYRKK